MKLFGRDLNKDIAIVAEIGLNHDGKLKKALRIVKLAADAGFDAVKFQIFSPDRFVSKDDISRFKRVKKLNLKDEDYLEIQKYANKIGIHMLGSAISEDKVSLCSKLGKAIKVASGDINFLPTINKIIKKKKIILLSSGNSTMEEIEKIIKHIKKKIGKKIKDKLILLHCVSAYPTPNNQSNVKKIIYFKKRFKFLKIGYSNHCIEPEPILAAVCYGASVIEVHITESKKSKKFRDHLLSFDKKNMNSLVKSIRKIKETVKIFSKKPMKSEEKVHLMRKGLVTSKDIKKGQYLKLSDISFARPATYFSAHDIDKIIGKKINVSLKKGQLFKSFYFH
jgi:N,N'-diacetyllegionaminate synthase